MVIGSGRPGTSRCLLQGYFSVGDGVCWVAERGGDVVGFEWGEFGDDLFAGHAVGEHAEHCCNRDPEPADAGDAAHLAGVYREANRAANAT